MAISCTTASGNPVGEAALNDEAALLARLQAQFGDMNVSSFLEGSASSSHPDGTSLTPSDDGQGGDDSSESSLEEPSAEELRAWQEAQFQKGRMHLEAQKIINSASSENIHKSALQRRRQNKSVPHKTLLRQYEGSEEGSEWEQLAQAPNLGKDSSSFFPTNLDDDDELELAGGVHPLLHKLVQNGDPEVLGTKWLRLYSSADGDGLSFRNLWNKMRGYDGPTLLLIGGPPSASRLLASNTNDNQQQKRISLGFFTIDSWIESPDYFGSDDDCFLFSLDYESNEVQIIRPRSRSIEGSLMSSSKQTKQFMYCHPSSLSKTKKQLSGVSNKTNGSVHGIGIGGTPSQPRLHITESLEECRALSYDHLFDDGDLLLGKGNDSLFHFDVDSLEVWGVGGEEWIADAIKAQTKQHEMQSASLEQARKVDKRQFLEDFENGMAWRSGNKPGLFGHRDLVDERDI